CLAEISLDVDADQDGVVEKNNANKLILALCIPEGSYSELCVMCCEQASWKWGPEGHGAILLVNCDSDSGKRPDNQKSFIGTLEDLKDMSQMVLRTAGPKELPKGHTLKLHMLAHDAEAAQVFTKRFSHEQGSGKLSMEIIFTEEMTFFVSGLKFADIDFSGLVRIHVSLLQPGIPETPIFTDTVQFKMAPWIMTPNVQAPLKVYVCSTPDNAQFIDGMKKLVQEVGVEMQIITNEVNRGDRWIQDEMEFGYIQAPHQSCPVVFDSPRDRDLDNFPYNELMGPDFGYVTFKPPRDEVNSLESFGNLEVSPPVTVKGKSYPLGRIIIGGAFPFQTDGRNMSSATRNFLRAQVVQEPIVLFSDWLRVGHVDEFFTFVPAKDRKGFRLLLASPHAAYKLLHGLQETGHGQAKFFEGQLVSLNNDYYQRCIDWNRDRLKNELELDEEDIVDIPLLYKPKEKGAIMSKGAVSYYPDSVNMIVLWNNLGIAKPFGPKVNGQCAIEKEVTMLLEPLGLKCNFINDFVPYYENEGDVHCGSNVRRRAFNLKWWEMEM
uniref:Peptidyl arginine deiminase, type II n=1 Tax=Neogobius melanostomus TaxID=47308 RepID=A0A8C6SD26_9GOBI